MANIFLAILGTGHTIQLLPITSSDVPLQRACEWCEFSEMGDRYVDDSPSGSDQDDLVDDSDLDVDLSDTEDLQFTFCKPSNRQLLQLDGGAQSSSGADHVTQQPDMRLRWRFFTSGVTLMLSSLVLLVCMPLYYQQMALSGKEYNAYGSLLFISFMVTLLLVILARACSILLKWDNEREFYRIPISWKRWVILINISHTNTIDCLKCFNWFA